MNVQSLIDRHPLLHADLSSLGLPRHTLHRAAELISDQLGSAQGNLCFILSRLSTREFVRTIDTYQIAEHTGISKPIAQSIVLTVAPWVGQFRLTEN